MTKYTAVWVCAFFFAGFAAGVKWPHRPLETMYGWRVERVMPPDSMAVVSPETGPFRADACPESRLQQYEPKAGYVFCRIRYVQRGCLLLKDFTWVKNNDANQSTATLSDTDTFKPWPNCHKDEETADARQAGNSEIRHQ